MALWSGGIHVAAILFLATASYSVEGSPRHVVCYYSSWAHYRQGLAKYTVDDIPVELCTHLIYAFATLDSKTFLAKPFDKWLDIDLKNYEKFVQLKKINPKMKVLLGVGGWNDSRSTKYSRMVADPIKRRKFVEEVVKLLLQHGFDGLDLDWEYPAYESRREDKEGFTRWVEDLKKALTPHNLLLTTAVSASRQVIDRGYDVPKIAKHLDLFNIMSYDFHGSWERKVAHHSPLYADPGQNPQFNSDFAVNYWIKKGVPAHKIVMGVPFYGRSWTLSSSGNRPGASASGGGRRGKYVKEKGHLAYYEICLAHQKDGWTKVNGEAGPYLTKGDQWVGYDDIDTVTKKAQYALDKGLGGIMVWDTVSDDFNNACGHGTNPLLTAIHKTFQGNPPSTTEVYNQPTTTTPSPPSSRSPQSIWRSGNPWKQQPSIGNLSGGSNSIGGSTGSKGSSNSQNNNDLPYEWLAWPIFSQSPENNQNSVSSSFITSTTPPTTTRFSSSFSSSNGGISNNKVTNGSGQNTKPYDWQSWPIFSNSQQNNQNSVSSNSGSSSFVTPSSTPSTTSFQFPSRFSSTSGATISNIGPNGIGGSSQTTKPPYNWLQWPVFNKSPQNSQNSISSNSGSTSFATPPSTSSTTKFRFPSRFSTTKGTTTNQGYTSFGGSTDSSTKSPYAWQSWPVFSGSSDGNQNSISSSGLGSSSFVTPTPASTTTRFHVTPSTKTATTRRTLSGGGLSAFGIGSQPTTKAPYAWLSWPVFNKSPEDTLNSNSLSLSSRRPIVTSTSRPSSFNSRLSLRAPSSSSSWFADCQVNEYAPDPSSCDAFYRCTNGYAYRFSCPAGLLWHQEESSCDWPESVQCNL